MTALVLSRRLSVRADLSTVRPAIVYAALFGALGAYFPYASVLLASRGLELGAIGLLLALHGVVSLVAAPAWGALADRAGDAGRPLLVSSLVAGLGAIALAMARDPLGIAAALAVLAVGTGGMVPLVDTRAVELAGASRERFARARAWGSAAFIAASVATGLLISARSPNVLFVLYIPLILATGLASWRLLATGARVGVRTHTRLPQRPGAGFVRLLRRPGLLGVLVGSTIVWTAVGAVMAFISIRIADGGTDLGVVGLTWAFGAAVEIPIMLLFPILARRVGAEPLLVLGVFAFAIRAVGWAIADDPVVYVLVAPFGGIGFALFYIGIVTVIARSVPAEAQATAQGLFTGMTFSLGAVVGSAIGGVAAPIVTLPGLFLASAAATVVGAVVLARAVSDVRPPAPVVAPAPVVTSAVIAPDR